MHNNLDRMFVSPLMAMAALVLLGLGIIISVWAKHIREEEDRWEQS